jgi:hypothetical protein
MIYIPSLYGDVNLRPTGKKSCVLDAAQLSPREQRALAEVESVLHQKGWLPEDKKLDGRLGNLCEIAAPLEKVAKLVAKALKPGRKLVTAVRFSDGKMTEIVEAPIAPETQAMAPYREPEVPAAPEEKGAIVARPTLGCPAPAFHAADVRATRVLCEFLSPEQLADWKRYNRIITVGAVTGHRYMITSRHATDTLAQVQRSLYDLDDKRPFCVHDWSVPAAEEVLALHLLVQLPRHENYLRHLE